MFLFALLNPVLWLFRALRFILGIYLEKKEQKKKVKKTKKTDFPLYIFVLFSPISFLNGLLPCVCAPILAVTSMYRVLLGVVCAFSAVYG